MGDAGFLQGVLRGEPQLILIPFECTAVLHKAILPAARFARRGDGEGVTCDLKNG